MKIIESPWFTGSCGLAGIILVEDKTTGDRKAFIGPAEGFNEEYDANRIVDWGSMFSLDKVLRIARLLKKEKEVRTK